MKLLLKRHPPTGVVITPEIENAFPSPSQIDIGELVINTITGKLYTKLDDNSVVEFISQKLCFNPIPEISFYYNNSLINPPSYLINNFCCAGGLLTVVIDKLKTDLNYSFILSELTNNTSQQNISIAPASYSTYSAIENEHNVTYRKATLPITMSIEAANYNNISLFQFTIVNSDTNKAIRGGDKILTIQCSESNNV